MVFGVLLHSTLLIVTSARWECILIQHAALAYHSIMHARYIPVLSEITVFDIPENDRKW